MTDKEFSLGSKKPKLAKGTAIAQKDFECYAGGDLTILIKEGDEIDLSQYPDWIIENLKTEKVLKG